MPVAFKVLDPVNYRLRHIGLAADLYAQGNAPSGSAVLGKTLVARPLVRSDQPAAPTFQSGQWTGRLGDTGTFQVVFPNVPYWRGRFKGEGATQFLEITGNDDLEFVGIIQKVQYSKQSVTVTGYDGMWLLKKSYEVDRQLVMAPRDVIEQYTAVSQLVVADNFQGSTLDVSKWTAATSGIGSSVTQANGALTIVSGVTGFASITSVAAPSISASRWRIQVNLTIRPGLNELDVDGPSPTNLQVTSLAATLVNGGAYAPKIPVTIGAAGVHTLVLESDGRWVRAYLDQQLVGYSIGASGAVAQRVIINVSSGGTVDVHGVIAQAWEPFLLRGSTKGDYVLPGSYTTYPAGGLHGRYYNDADLQMAVGGARESQILSPLRDAVQSGGGPGFYADRLDATINLQANVQPGAATSMWSARWFGAVYLPLASHPGTYTFVINLPTAGTGYAVRVWVGKTQFGDQIINQWTLNSTPTQTPSGTVTTASLGSVDGWYPVVIEYAVATPTGSSAAPVFEMSAPANYTDPGGSSITTSFGVVPATSLSPLGCVDQRIQGQSHFDVVQKTAQAYGLQLSPLPMPLESGEFPCRLAPLARQGQDTDVVVEPDTNPRAERSSNYSNVLDSEDQVATLRGNGAGLPNGNGAQMQAVVFDPTAATSGLFVQEGWQDSGDAAFPALLAATLNSQLGLRLTAWQQVAADPEAFGRLADTFPLTGALSAMRWRPGDGVRLKLPDVSVDDFTPRQMLQVTREFVPTGRTKTTAQFRNRPRSSDAALRQSVYATSRLGRVYQRQLVTLNSAMANDSVTTGNFGSFAILGLAASETVVRCIARVLVSNPGSTVDLEINGTLRGSSIGGPWTVGAITGWDIDITPYAVPFSVNDNRVLVRMKNTGANTVTLDVQLIATVMR